MRTQVTADMFSVVLVPMFVRRPDFLGSDVAIVQRGIYDSNTPFHECNVHGHPLRSVVVVFLNQKSEGRARVYSE